MRFRHCLRPSADNNKRYANYGARSPDLREKRVAPLTYSTYFKARRRRDDERLSARSAYPMNAYDCGAIRADFGRPLGASNDVVIVVKIPKIFKEQKPTSDRLMFGG